MEQFIFQTEPYEDFYEVKEELGRGNFAFVKRCEHRETGKEYAAKCITKKRSKASKRGMSKEAIASEAGILSALNHEGIIKIYDAFEARQTITLIMELLTGGELFEEISKEEFILEKDACNYTKQILSAMQHMHEMNIIHLDLKPENIVLKHRGSKEIKLIDFGLAKVIEPGKEIREMMGTPEFAAPEVINFELIGLYTDMWAIGVVTYILLSGASPFLGDDDQETYQNITSCEYDFDEEYFAKITENAKDFVRKLLLKKTKERNTVQDCLNHPWIASEEEETSIIDTKKMRAFVARRRWKQSLKLVATISRLKVLCRSSIPSPTSDMSGDEGSGTVSPTSPKDLALMMENSIDFGQEMIIPPEVVSSDGKLIDDYNKPMTKVARDEDLGFANHDINENYDLGTEKGIGHRQIDRSFSVESDYMQKLYRNTKIATEAIAPQSLGSLVKVMQDDSKVEAGKLLWGEQRKAANFDERQVKKRPDAGYMMCSDGRPQHDVNHASTNNVPELWSSHGSQFTASDKQVKKRPDAGYMMYNNGRPKHDVNHVNTNNAPEHWSSHGSQFTARDTKTCETASDGMSSALPEQTVAALSENLPWDPELSLTVPAHSKTSQPRNQAVASFEIPKVREHLVPDVRLRNDVIKRPWEKASIECTNELDYSSQSNFLSENSIQVNRLSPNMAEIGGGSYNLDVNERSKNMAFDRRKQRTIRRINWDTNYIPPLDCQPKPISPMIKRAVIQPVRKETSV